MTLACEPREAYGVRAACCRFWMRKFFSKHFAPVIPPQNSTAAASCAHSIRFAVIQTLPLFPSQQCLALANLPIVGNVTSIPQPNALMKKPSCPPNNTGQAFTLVELLVVIGII